MSRRALVIFDGSDISIKGLSHALTFSEKGDTIDLLYIVDRNTYNSILEGIKSMGGGENDINRALSELEHRFRKQISMFLQECRDSSINVNTVFKIGNIGEELLNELRSKRYDLLVIPYSEKYIDKLSIMLGKIMTEYKGNILIVK